MATAAEAGWHLKVAADDPRILRAAERAANDLGLPHEVTEPEELHRSDASSTVFCLGSRTALSLPSLPGPCVVVCSGEQVRDEALIRLARGWVAPVRLAELSGATLLRCLVELATHSRLGEPLLGFILVDESLARVPKQLMNGFLRKPAAATLADIGGIVGVSKAEARRLVRKSGFTDPRHLLTALRARAWEGLTRLGMDRRFVETYLGIRDRSTFRRSCNSAGVPVPWSA